MARIIPIALIGLALVLYALWRGAYPDLFEETEPAPPAQTAATPETAPSAEAPDAAGTPAAAPAAEPDKLPATPQLDVVRINEDGDTVIAGKAEPGASVTIATQDGPLATVKADERGKWVALPEKPLPAGDHAVTIESTGKNGKKEVGDKTIVVSIPEGTGGKPLVVAVPTRGFGASEVIQRPESPPGGEPPAAPEKPVVLAQAPKDAAQPAGADTAGSRSQQAAAAGEGATQGGGAGEQPVAGKDAAKAGERPETAADGRGDPSPTAAQAPASGEQTAPSAGSATQAAQQQAPAAGKAAPATAGTEETRVAARASGKAETGDEGNDRAAGQQTAATSDDRPAEDKTGEAPPTVAKAPAKPEQDRPAPAPVTAGQQAAATGEERLSEDKAGEASPTVAKAPAKPEQDRPASPSATADRKAAAAGEDQTSEDKAGEAPPTVAEAPAKPDQDRPAAGRQAAATGEDASGEERTEAPAAMAAAAPEKSQPAGADASARPAGQQAADAAPAGRPEEDRPAAAAETPAAPAGTATPAAPAATASAAPTPAPEGAQAAAGGKPQPGGVSVDSVDYDDKGNLALSGTAKPGSTVEPKIAGGESGSESLGKARADEKGEWRLRVERDIAPGRYDLTVEERSPEGAPRSRIRLPFERADPITDFPPGDIVVVQPGNSLWRIARRVYGQGIRYTVIYAANQAQIGNPDLIFPGQIFSVPQEDRTARAPG